MPIAKNVSRIITLPQDDGSVVLEIYDHEGKAEAYCFNLDGVRGLLETAIYSATQLAGQSGLSADEKRVVLTELNAPIGEASKFELTPGRSPAESLVKIGLENLVLSFFMPLGSVIEAFVKLREQIHNPPRH